MLRYLLIAAASYLLGSISSSVLISRYVFHADVRSEGSGNAGATNMARVFGMKSGFLVFLCDALKTIASLVIGWLLAADVGLAVAGCACNIGHCYPVFFRFRGGKGVSVAAMIACALDWRLAAGLLAVFLVLVLSTRYVSLGSCAVGLLMPFVCLLLHLSAPRCVLGAVTGVLVLFQHRANIGRLLRGEESRFSPGGKK